jgi:hypothetical protein
MKKVLLGTAVLLALLTGCTEEKKAPVQTETSTTEVKKDEVLPAVVAPADEELEKEELAPKESEEMLPTQDEEPVEQSK